jgi:hypothetical protein
VKEQDCIINMYLFLWALHLKSKYCYLGITCINLWLCKCSRFWASRE